MVQTEHPFAGFEIEPYRLPWWLRGSHSQTLLSQVVRRTRGVSFQRERISTPDGDFLDLDYPEVVGAPEPEAAAPVVLLLHGLEGSARRHYALETYRQLARRGLRAVGLNFRSCSGELNRTTRFYHGGDTDDLELVLHLLCKRYPTAPRGAVGFSLGGNLLLKYLGEAGHQARNFLQAAAAVSPPFDLAAAARGVARPSNWLYNRLFLQSMKQKVIAKAAELEGRVDLLAALAARTIWEFDAAVTARLNGFGSVEAYYEQTSSRRVLAGIRVPTLILRSRNDPFFPDDDIPHAALAANPYLQGAFPFGGGHVGFVMGAVPWAARLWAEQEVARFLQHALSAAR